MPRLFEVYLPQENGNTSEADENAHHGRLDAEPTSQSAVPLVAVAYRRRWCPPPKCLPGNKLDAAAPPPVFSTGIPPGLPASSFELRRAPAPRRSATTIPGPACASSAAEPPRPAHT